MCGIAGIYQLQGHVRVDRRALIGMRDTITHRGPDGSGIYMDEKARVGLAHRRLSIIDLADAAAQPMSDKAGEVLGHI